MMNYFKSLLIIARFSVVLIAGTLFFVGLGLKNEFIILTTGIIIIGYYIYKKINQIWEQVTSYKQLPEEFREMMANGNIDKTFGFNQKTNDEDNKRGYQ